MANKNRILIAPLNWGLGHATRCIPIIEALVKNNFDPIIASDGNALELLKKEFPVFESLQLPSYNITYSRKGGNLRYKLLKDSPKIIKNILAEKKATSKIVNDYDISGIISDNRFGVYNKKVPSVFITHQLQVLSGNTTWLSTKLHNKIIKEYDECWIPDHSNEPNLSGKLGHVDATLTKLKYIGPISRFEKVDLQLKYDIMIVLSGPEPQRSILEQKLIVELQNYSGKVLFVKGVVEADMKKEVKGNIVFYNYMTSSLLEDSLNRSNVVISRSGYTSIMDLAKLGKKAFFIPTPGQFEQEYLADKLNRNKLVPSCKQEAFTMDKLNLVNNYKGLSAFDYETDYTKLFSLFQTK